MLTLPLSRALRPSAAPARAIAARFASSQSSSSAADKSLQTATQAAHEASGLTTSHPSEEIVAADILSDAPPALHYRPVRIYKPTKNTMQSGRAGYNHWRLDWDTLQGAGRWENKLMGWASSADYMQGTGMKFKTKEAAIHFAEKQGWDYQVTLPNDAGPIKPKTYADNYVHVPGKLRIAHTK